MTWHLGPADASDIDLADIAVGKGRRSVDGDVVDGRIRAIARP
jgi:hypothetical protein